MKLELVGLDGVKGKTFAERRAAVLRASDRALASRLVSMALSLRKTGQQKFSRLAALAGLPVGEVLASPFGLRAISLGVRAGAKTIHQELRAPNDWTHTLKGVPKSVRDPMHGQWDRGFLRTGKYQAFLQDEPFAHYQPSYIAKWGPHEMMHRAARYFWREDFSNWELYVASRLNELVPVVLWYGPDQVLRLGEDGFDKKAAGEHPNADVRDAHWLREPSDALFARALRTARHLRDGLVHFENELRAVDREMRTGRTMRVPHPFLDASSDAIAYVAGHAARLRKRGVVQALELTAAESDRSCTVEHYRYFVEALFDELLFGTIEIDDKPCKQAFERRLILDWAHRIGHSGMPSSKTAGALRWVGNALAASGSVDSLAEQIFSEWGPDADRILANGAWAIDLHELRRGLLSSAPLASSNLPDAELAAFATSAAMVRREALTARFGSFMETREAWRSEVASLEHFVRGPVLGSDEFDVLWNHEALNLVAPEKAWVMANPTFVVKTFAYDVLDFDGREPPRESQTHALLGRTNGEPVVVAIDARIAKTFERIAERGTTLAQLREVLSEAAVGQLFASGAIAWRRSRPNSAARSAESKPRRPSKALPTRR